MLHIMYDLTKISYIFISILYIVFANLSKKFGYILYFIRIKDNYIDDLYSHFVQIHSEHNYNTSPLCHSERSVSGVEESMWCKQIDNCNRPFDFAQGDKTHNARDTNTKTILLTITFICHYQRIFQFYISFH